MNCINVLLLLLALSCEKAIAFAANIIYHQRRIFRDPTKRWARKPTTSAGQERRDEDKRRKERSKDVVVGKTSAKPGEKDFAVDVSATEQEWMRQASDIEQRIFKVTDKGLEHLKMLELQEADACFSEVFELKPDAYLWQAGIVKYYLGEIEAAADIFARCAQLYESRFFDPASEERIWRHACELTLISGLKKYEKKDQNVR